MKLSTLLKGIGSFSVSDDCDVTGLSLSTTTIKSGDLFFALAGHVVDGRSFVAEAIAQGACAVLYEQNDAERFELKATAVPCIAVSDLHKKIGAIAASFHDEPSRQLALVGVTGTNGKSSCVGWLSEALNACNTPCGLIGTLHVGFDQLEPASLTTPDALSLQQHLADFSQQGAKAVAMEVSSHALVQGRVEGVHFTGAVFTQLSRDHLDYHGSMQAYAEAKSTLFAYPELQFAVVNWDDELGRKLYYQHKDRINMVAYSLHVPTQEELSIVYAKTIQASAQGYIVGVVSPWGEGQLYVNVMGRFNISNQLAVLSTMCSLGVDFTKALSALNAVAPILGRMQYLAKPGQPTVVVDYAHTPDALKQALLAVREHCSGSLWCVFGCGGNRDQGKRPQMGQVAEAYADNMVLTNDNPRQEVPEKIIHDILAGVDDKNSVTIEMDRASAIKKAVAEAAEGDVILIAGKGHEDYQLLGEKRLTFSDWQHAELALMKENVL